MHHKFQDGIALGIVDAARSLVVEYKWTQEKETRDRAKCESRMGNFGSVPVSRDEETFSTEQAFSMPGIVGWVQSDTTDMAGGTFYLSGLGQRAQRR